MSFSYMNALSTTSLLTKDERIEVLEVVQGESTPVILILSELFPAEPTLPRCGVLGHMALETAVGTETSTADRALEGALFSWHGCPPLPPHPVSVLRLADY